MANYFYIYAIVLLISLVTLSGSMYGMGVNDNNKDSAAYSVASVFFNLSLICTLISTVLIIKDADAHNFCSVMKDINENLAKEA